MLQTKFSYSREKKKRARYLLLHAFSLLGRFKRHVTAVQIEVRFKHGTLHNLVSNACNCLAELNSYILNAFDESVF